MTRYSRMLIQYFRSPVGRYVAALLAIVVALVLTFAANRTVGVNLRAVRLTFFAAMMIAAWNGYGPGILATIVVSFVLPYLFSPSFTAASLDLGAFGTLLLVSLLISRISATRSHVEEVLRKSNEDLDARVRQRTAELELANAALQDSEERFSFFMRHLPGAAWMKDLQGRYVYANPTAERIFNAPLELLLGKADDEVFPAEVAAQFQENARIALNEGRNLETIESLPQPDGLHYSVVSKFPIFGPDGKTIMVGGIAIDITDRRKAQQAAHDRLAELEHLYETAPVGLGFMDTELRFMRLNGQLAAINGAPVSAHIGRTIREMLPAQLAEMIEPLHRQVLESGQPILDRELRSMSPAQPEIERDYQVSYSPVKSADGSLLGVQVMVQDITERKRFDEQLRQTAKLESLGILAGGVAHDFNNLLTGILGNASLVEEVISPGDPLHPLLQDVIAASEQASHLTRQLLAYAGKGRFMVESLDISALVREISSLLRASIPKNVDLRLELKEPIFRVAADSSQIQQLVMNLVINGAEAIPAGAPGVVRVRTWEQDIDAAYLRTGLFVVAEGVQPGQHVGLEVEDTGSGMDEETLKRIFDPFFSTKFTGRGLGLAATMGIVRGHRGALAVSSFPGAGSTFRILLPKTERQAKPRGAAPVPARVEAGGLVLVIDDEEMVRRTAETTLKRYGYTVMGAKTGQEGIEVFKRCAAEIRLVVLDLTMPGIGGEETLRGLRRIRADVKVILSSGYDEAETLRHFTKDGLPDAFIQKPYTAASLAGKVSRVLG